jgi:hypothetical protein
MKLKFIEDFDSNRLKKGYEVEADKIKYSPRFAGYFAVRVVSVWKRPKWIAIAWFVSIPTERQ